MSLRYDRVTISMEYSADFSAPAPGMQGRRNVTWAFLPIDKKAERLATLLRWNAEDAAEDTLPPLMA
jgi:hypothetical protein